MELIILEWIGAMVEHHTVDLHVVSLTLIGITVQFTNGFGQVAYHLCAPSLPRSEWVPDQGQFLLFDPRIHTDSEEYCYCVLQKLNYKIGKVRAFKVFKITCISITAELLEMAK